MTQQRHAEFTFDGDFSLSEKEIWPDGDAPENWGTSDVVAVIQRCGGLKRVMHDWDLDQLLHLSIWVDGDIQEVRS